ncbi:hypothetical protein NHH03_19035 [Stieleria sp. TO1_6]|uniref:hypothetical protein n=1 Tax=Stieleria tagensis TaxID=2956795 RepID=UPI00209B2968|nr:hypothetical protein [Stieleria tagensis]MCO8123848.1 hypothetical protein [Stieleria tagensis]
MMMQSVTENRPTMGKSDIHSTTQDFAKAPPRSAPPIVPVTMGAPMRLRLVGPLRSDWYASLFTGWTETFAAVANGLWRSTYAAQRGPRE